MSFRVLKILIPITLISIIGGLFSVYSYFSKDAISSDEIVTVKKGDIVETVVVTGKTRPVQNVDLAFQNSGKISQVFADVGDKVLPGQILAEMEKGELNAQLLEAEANLDGERAGLEELKRGTRVEEINVKNLELGKAEQDLLNDYDDVLDVLSDAYTKSDDAVRTKTSAIFTGSKNSFYQLTFSACDVDAGSGATNLRLASEVKLEEWRKELDYLRQFPSTDGLEFALRNGKLNLNLFKNLLEKINDALVTGCNINNLTLDSYRSNINTGRANLVLALSAINNQEQSIFSQKLTVEKIRNELNLMLAGATIEEIQTKESKVKIAEAKVQLINEQINKTLIKSPIGGTVTKQDAKLGEIVSANMPLISVISESFLEIEANVPEVDIGRILPGNTAKITLDALPNEFFYGEVSYIDPAETIIDGVVNFKIKIDFDKKDIRFKSGLTANLTIQTAKKENVLVIPQFAVLEKDNGNFVKKLTGNEVIEIPVQLGKRGEDGLLEIISGLSEGDKILNIGFKRNE